MASRSRRTFTCEAALWRADDERLVVRIEIVTVTADRRTGQAVAIPAEMWAGIERLEGRAIPMAERASA